MHSPLGYVFWRMIYPFASIADGLINLLTLTFIMTNLRYHALFHMAKCWAPKKYVEQLDRYADLVDEDELEKIEMKENV